MSLGIANETDGKTKPKEVINPISKRFKCDIDGCHKSFDRRFEIKRHLESHLKGNIKNDPEELAGKKIYQCNEEGCGESFTRQWGLTRHMQKIHKLTLSKTKKDLDKVVINKKQHKCDEPGCDAVFARPYRLNNHKLTHHRGDRPFKCNYKDCGKSYTNESHLNRHKKISHCSEIYTKNEVICGMIGCGRIFSNKSNLIKHIARNHRDLPFECQECDEKFTRKSRLHAHMTETHGKEAPYKCSKCPKMFVQYHLYNKHLKNHKTFKCDCQRTFGRWSKLVEHRRTDCTAKKQEHKCVICDKTFALKQNLTQHSMMVHVPDSQIELLKCPYLNCKHTNKYKRNLNHHIQSFHQKISNEVKCPENNCGAVLKSNKNLKQHIRTFHSGLPPKIRQPRKPRKDKGLPKKSMASKISGAVVSFNEDIKNIQEQTDDLVLKIFFAESEETKNKNIDKLKSIKDEYREQCLKSIPKCADGVSKFKNETGTSGVLMRSDNGLDGTENRSILEEPSQVGDCTIINIDNKESPNESVELKALASNQDAVDDNTLVVSMDIDSQCSKIPTVLNIAPEFDQLQSNSNLKEPQRNSKGELDGIVESLDNHSEQNATNEVKNSLIKTDDNKTSNMENFLGNCSQSSCDSGVVIFDFPEFEENSSVMTSSEVNILNNIQEQPITNNVGDNFIPNGNKLKKRFDLMLKDIFVVLKHLEK